MKHCTVEEPLQREGRIMKPSSVWRQDQKVLQHGDRIRKPFGIEAENPTASRQQASYHMVRELCWPLRPSEVP